MENGDADWGLADEMYSDRLWRPGTSSKRVARACSGHVLPTAPRASRVGPQNGWGPGKGCPYPRPPPPQSPSFQLAEICKNLIYYRAEIAKFNLPVTVASAAPQNALCLSLSGVSGVMNEWRWWGKTEDATLPWRPLTRVLPGNQAFSSFISARVIRFSLGCRLCWNYSN